MLWKLKQGLVGEEGVTHNSMVMYSLLFYCGLLQVNFDNTIFYLLMMFISYFMTTFKHLGIVWLTITCMVAHDCHSFFSNFQCFFSILFYLRKFISRKNSILVFLLNSFIFYLIYWPIVLIWIHFLHVCLDVFVFKLIKFSFFSIENYFHFLQ